MLAQPVAHHERGRNALRDSKQCSSNNAPVMSPHPSSKIDIRDQSEACEQDGGDHENPGCDIDERAMVIGSNPRMSVER